MRFGRDVSRFAYQSPPPLYLSKPILKEGSLALDEMPAIRNRRRNNLFMTWNRYYILFVMAFMVVSMAHAIRPAVSVRKRDLPKDTGINPDFFASSISSS